MSGLCIESVRLAHAGIIDGELDLGPFADGITLITGPNETGKSTVVEMLRAALFERHNAKHAGLRALQPHGTKEAPEIWLDFRLGDTKYNLHKRFLERPMAELTVTQPGQASQQFVGADADAEVWSVLKAETPGSRGARTSDMGAWGLLWVTQDEAAFSDPAATLGSEARVALQDAIGRQVSQVLGGRDGERIRNRLKEEYGRYWTQAQQRPTGQLAQAEEAVKQGQQRIHGIEAALNGVATQAQDYEDWVARAQALKTQRPAMVAEVSQAEAEAERLQGLQAAAALAKAHAESAQDKLQVAERSVTERQAQAQALTERQAQAQALSEEAQGLKVHMQARADDLGQAKDALQTAEQAVGEAKAGAKAAKTLWQKARAAGARHEAQRALDAAKSLQERRSSLQQDLQNALSDSAYTSLNRRQVELEATEAALLHTGTRLEVGQGTEAEPVRCAGRSTQWQIPGLGAVSVRPAQAGLTQARGEREAMLQKLQANLLGLGVESVAEAKDARRARKEDEAALVQATAELQRVAPDGLEALLKIRTEALAEVEGRVRTRQEAERLTKDVQVQCGLRDAHPVSEVQLQDVERLSAVLDQLDAARQAAATRVTVRMQDGLPVLREQQACATDEDGAVRLTITQDTELQLGALAEVRIEPGGEGLGALQARTESTQAELTEQLKQMGVADLLAAKAVARARQEAETLLKGLRAQLGQVAPNGLTALQEALQLAQQRSKALEQATQAAQRSAQQAQAIERRLATNLISEEALARVIEAQAEHDRAEQQVQSKAAHLTIAAQSWTCEAPTSGDVQGLGWTLVPGEGGAELDMKRQQLREAMQESLRASGLDSLEDARRSWQQGLTVASTLCEVQRGLDERAPEGLQALQAAAAGALPDDEHAATTLPELEQAQANAQTQVEADEVQRAAAQQAINEAQGRHSALNTTHAESQVRAAQAARDVEEGQARLEVARVGDSDASLAEGLVAAQAVLEDCKRAQAGATAALQAHNPELVQGEADRARRTLKGHDEALREHQDKIAGLEALLAKASAQGRFEELGEAQVELTQAQEGYARVLRDAEATKRLYTVVESRYAETQRRFLAPVVEQARPYLQAIRPGSQLTMTPDLGVDKLVRAGAEEAFDRLSGGTREQLSVIVRLALAQVLAKDGLPMPLILDDTMGWTDDSRFSQMVRILRSASKTLQLIILTCHPARFARLEPERTIDLEVLRKGLAPTP